MSRGSVVVLGFIIGKILHRQKLNVTASSSLSPVELMDVDDTQLHSAVSSAVHQLGECSVAVVFYFSERLSPGRCIIGPADV